MAYKGKHRCGEDDLQGNRRIVKVAGVAGMAATAAAVVAVGMGAGTANADGLFGHFGPKKPTTDSSSSSNTVNTGSLSNTVSATRTGPSLITVKPSPSPQRSILQYVTPGQKGTGVAGICLFNC